jgi:hypothetical protein
MATAKNFTENSEAGYFRHELENVLMVGMKETLLKLVYRKQLFRERIQGVYLYCSQNASIRKKQIAVRRALLEEAEIGRLVLDEKMPAEEVKAALLLFSSLLDEKQLRLFAGMESLKLGRGGDRMIADLLGVDPHTVAKGRQQLIERDFDIQRIRKTGAGRKSVKKNSRSN